MLPEQLLSHIPEQPHNSTDFSSVLRLELAVKKSDLSVGHESSVVRARIQLKEMGEGCGVVGRTSGRGYPVDTSVEKQE